MHPGSPSTHATHPLVALVVPVVDDRASDEVAERLATSPSYVGNVETGRLNLTIGQLARAADAWEPTSVSCFP